MKNMYYRIFVSLLILAGYLKTGVSEDILVLMPLPARSHFKSFQPLFEELIIQGHNLTLVSGHSLNENVRGRYSHVNIKHHFSKLNIVFAEMRKQNRLYNFIFSSNRIVEYLEHVLQDQQVQNLISSKDVKFSSVIVELFFMDVFVAFGNIFNAPVVGLSAQHLIPFYGWTYGNPTNPSYLPNLFLPFNHQMTFIERFLNAFYNGITSLYYEHVILEKHQKLKEKYIRLPNRNDIPKIKIAIQNVSLILVNSHFTFGYPRPNLPNVIEVAGLHISGSALLPKNIEKFMNEASDGIIYISFGSLIQPDDIQPMGNAFLKILENLPQKVIFKWNPKLLSYIPDNFLVQEWVPQAGILRHPNCRLFVTHGGLHSLIETVNYSVPVVGIPFFTDQQYNMALVEYLGVGKTLDIGFSHDQLSKTIHAVLSNPKYYENAKRQSGKFNDRIVSPVNTAVYWIEYIMRHDDLSHLKSSSTQLYWYQYLLLDVLLFSILLFTSLLGVICLLIKFTFNLSRRIAYLTSLIINIRDTNNLRGNENLKLD